MVENWQNSGIKYPVILLIGLLIISTIYLVRVNLGRKQAINTTYCYYINNEHYQKVYGSKSIKQGYEDVVEYYLGLESNDNKIVSGMVGVTDRALRVEVMYYTMDSLLAKIRYVTYTRQKGGFDYEVSLFVPVITLHDSLPSTSPNDN